MDNSIPKGCKPFDLEKAMAGEPVVTRDGIPYKFGAYNPDAENYKIVGWINRTYEAHLDNGKYLYSGDKSSSDLFMAAKTQKVWVNLWRDGDGGIKSHAFVSEELAETHKSITADSIFLKTIETEVEL